jgi:deazaflavin-dependent oxidoreductase (nitroreductase family)
VGRRSGQPREIEIWFAADPHRDRIYILAGGRDRAHWVRNLRANREARVRIGQQWFSGIGAEVEGAADDPVARQLLAAKYYGWTDGRPLPGWTRHALPVAIDLRW